MSVRTISLSEPMTARARTLAEALDQGMADRIAASEDQPGMIEIGIGAILGQLRTDPQGLLDDNLDYLLLVQDALNYVLTGETSELLAEWSGGHLPFAD
jgi:hypothetical protein